MSLLERVKHDLITVKHDFMSLLEQIKHEQLGTGHEFTTNTTLLQRLTLTLSPLTLHVHVHFTPEYRFKVFRRLM